ncbi:hypothetical protein [Streptomyces sp. NPDC001635]
MGKYPWTVYVESKPEKLQPGGKATFAVDIRNTGNQPHQPEITLDFWLQRAYTPNENPLVKAEDTTAGIATIPKMTSPSRNFKPQDPHITWVDNDHNAVRYIITTANPLPAGDTISFDLLDMPIADGEGKGRLDVLLGSVDERTKGDWEQPQPQYFEKTSTAVTASRSERLLRFEMVDGDPINAGKKGGFTFRVYPEKNQDVSCARISVSAETGEKPTSLCSSAADLQNCPKPPTGWKKAPNKKTGELWAFVPDGIRESAPQVQTFKKGKQILFPFSDVPFSEIPGEVTLTFRAESAEKSGHTASEETIIPKALTKHAAGFEFAHFAPTFPAVEHGTPAQFTWHAQGVIKYILHTPEGISIENPARSDTTFRTHALTKSTGFVLEAFSEGFLSHRLGTTVDILGGESTNYDTVEVSTVLKTNSKYHHIPYSYNLSKEQKKPKTLELPGQIPPGNRHAVIGMTKPATSGKNFALKVKVGNTNPVDICLDGSNSPATIYLPPRASITIEPNEEWKRDESKANITADVSLALSDPRTLPPDPYSVPYSIFITNFKNCGREDCPLTHEEGDDRVYVGQRLEKKSGGEFYEVSGWTNLPDYFCTLDLFCTLREENLPKMQASIKDGRFSFKISEEDWNKIYDKIDTLETYMEGLKVMPSDAGILVSQKSMLRLVLITRKAAQRIYDTYGFDRASTIWGTKTWTPPAPVKFDILRTHDGPRVAPW